MSSTSNSDNKRIAKNTGVLYVRTLFTMFVGFYTSRLILNTLGVSDFGIWNVVAGFVSMFAILTNSMTAAIQRYITIELGKNNEEVLQKTFSCSLIILAGICLVVLLLAETVGLWFINSQLDLGQGRTVAANIVYQSSLMSFILGLLSIPYGACIVANEKMGVYAYISIGESCLKLASVLILLVVKSDKLIAFALFTFVVSLVVRLIYGYYCKVKFPYTSLKWVRDKGIYKSMVGFAGWSFIGQSAKIIMNQGANILFNNFFGLLLNASRGIAMQVENAVYAFVMNFTMAIVPQITKSYAKNDFGRMNYLIIKGANISFYLMWLFSFPILLETETLLRFWLKSYPDYSVDFVRLAMVICLIRTFSNTLETAINATGKIKYYQIVVGGINLLILPVCYLFLKRGETPNVIYFVIIVFNFITLFIKSAILSRLTVFSQIEYVKKVICNAFIIVLLSSIFPLLLRVIITDGFVRFLSVCSMSVVCVFITVYFIGLNRNERNVLLSYVNKRIHKK